MPGPIKKAIDLAARFARRNPKTAAVAGAATIDQAAQLSPRVIYTDVHDSTAIARVGYNKLAQDLHIVFKNRPGYPEYIWGGVPAEVAADFLGAGSKGSYYHSNIKGRSAYRIRSPVLGSFRLASVGKRLGNVFRRNR